MRADLLLLVAKKLETLPANRFDFEVWVGPDWKGHADLSCGASACALGWATTIPEIAALGLVLRSNEDTVHGFVDLESNKPPTEDYEYSRRSINAAGAVFEISYEAAQYLFIPGSWDNGLEDSAEATEVAAHIRAFVTRGGMPEYDDE